MPSEQNIIGVCKELQKRFEETEKGKYSNVGLDIVSHFPAIAEALLIAVEALEGIALMDDPGWFKSEIGVPRHAAEHARNMLSRIHSLPTNGNI